MKSQYEYDETIEKLMRNDDVMTALNVLDHLKKDSDDHLSNENQIRQIECLIYLKQFNKANIFCDLYMKLGNTSKEMLFLKGVICLKMNNFSQAQLCFRKYPNWNRWYQKAILMEQIANNEKNEICFGFPSPPKELNFKFTDETQYLLLTFYLEGITKNDLNVDITPEKMDITVNYHDLAKLSRTIHFYQEVNPLIDFKFEKNFFEIKIAKTTKLFWNHLEKQDLSQIPSDLEIEKYIQSFPKYSNEEAAALFEQSYQEFTEMNI